MGSVPPPFGCAILRGGDNLQLLPDSLVFAFYLNDKKDIALLNLVCHDYINIEIITALFRGLSKMIV